MLVASVVGIDPDGIVSTGPVRYLILSVGTLAVAAALLMACSRLVVERKSLWIACICIAVMGTSVTAATDWRAAVFGTPDRRLGLMTGLGFAVWCVAGHALGLARRVTHVVRSACIAAVAIGLWCTFELAGRSFIGTSFPDHRLGGPFGQPAYLGATCALFLPLAFAQCVRSEPRWWRCVGMLAVVSSTFGLIGSQTRGAWVGAFFAAVAVGAARAREIQVREKRVRVRVRLRDGVRQWCLLAAALVVGGAIALVAFTPIGGRAASAFDFSAGTTRGRIDEWRVAVRVIASHPIVGVGPDNYRIAFIAKVDPAYVRRYGSSNVSDRAHNGLLDVAASVGIAGGLAYAAALGMLVRRAWRALRGGNHTQVAIGAAVIAYIVQQMVLFPLAEVDPWFWLLCGLMLGLGREANLVNRTTLRPDPIHIAGRWFATATVGAIALVTTTYGVDEIRADRALRSAARSTDSERARAFADTAIRLRPDSLRVWFVAARVAARGPAITDLDRALTALERGFEIAPGDPALILEYADALTSRAQRSGLEPDAATARRVVSGSLLVAPNAPRLWLDRARLAVMANRRDEALAAMKKATFLAPTDRSVLELERDLAMNSKIP